MRFMSSVPPVASKIFNGKEEKLRPALQCCNVALRREQTITRHFFFQAEVRDDSQDDAVNFAGRN